MTHDILQEYIIGNYDDIDILDDVSANREFRDKNQKPAPMVRLSKRIGGTYYIAEAVPDTKKRTPEVVSAVVSAYKEKAADNQTKDGKDLPLNVRNASDATAFADSVYQNSDNVKSFFEENNNISSDNGGEVKYSLPARGQRQTETEKFKAWFGDWENDPENASKVVDEDGELITVSHSICQRRRLYEDRIY